MSLVKLKYPLKIKQSILPKGTIGESLNISKTFSNMIINDKSSIINVKFEGFDEILIDKKQVEKCE